MPSANMRNASLIAIAAMLASAPPPAKAQSFDATPTVVAGSALISVSPGRTNIEVNQPNAVINWVPNTVAGSTGPINFQPVGTTAVFTNLDVPNFSVLNRIIPTDVTRPVVFNGTVISQLQNPLTGAITRGGTVFFYSPGGILVGSTGVFNVGNLALTSSDLAYDSVTGSFGTGGTFRFLPANAGSSVEIRPGARITAGPFASYVALVAPKVVNSGTITVDGSAVLVAADASTITFQPNGLFDIQVDQGTSAAGEVLTNDGTIRGAAGTINSSHRVYMVAVPRNDAITMAIQSGSTLGFDIASAADVDGNAIVLSAGYNVSNGAIGTVRASNGGTGRASLQVGAIDATSQLTGRATGQAALTVDSGNAANFASNVSLAGVTDPGGVDDSGAIVSVSGIGSTLDVTGNLLVTALDAGQVTAAAFSDSGKAQIAVDRATMTVGGSVTIDASRAPGGALAATGGQASLTARNGAQVQIDGDVALSASGTGTTTLSAVPSGPTTGTGGTARLASESGAAVSIGGNLALRAAGVGGGATINGFAGADGTGGNAVIEGPAGAGRLTVTGSTLLDARGIGGDGLYCFSCTVEGGQGGGGSAGISSGIGARFEFGGALTVEASGLGGQATIDGGKDGGSAVGGQAFVRSTGGEVVATGAISLLADGLGGAGAESDTGVSGATGFGGAGGTGTGGTAILSAGDASALGMGGAITLGSATVSANGTGGSGNRAEAGFGGQALVSARNGTISGSGALSINASGSGGAGLNGGDGGTGRGGTSQVMAYSALEGEASVTFTTAVITARGAGGEGGTPDFATGPGGAGGIGSGGQVSVLAEAGNGTIGFGETNLNASGAGGNGGDGAAVGGIPNIGEDGGAGGIGRGGNVRLGVVSGLDTGAINRGQANFSEVLVAADATGGNGGLQSPADVTPGQAGRGGNALGGAAALVAEGGVVNLPGGGRVSTDAVGGIGGGSGAGLGAGGNAFVGGTSGGDGLFTPLGVRLDVASRTGHADQRGRLTGGALAFSAAASGGTGGPGGAASVLDHPLIFRLDRGTINAVSLDFSAVGSSVPGAAPSVITLAGGNTTLTGAFSFTTPGTLTAALAGSDLFSDTATISASNWLPGAVPAGPSGTIHGTTSVSLLSTQDLLANLSAETSGSLALDATGLVRLDNLTATGNIAVSAGTTLSLGNLSAGGTVTVAATGNAGVGNVVAGGDAVLSSGAALSAGGITSRQSVRLTGPGSVTLGGNVVAGASIVLSSDGAIAGQGLSAGLVNPSIVSGASYDVTVVGLGGIGLGNVAAAHDIKLFTPLGITAGALSGREMALLSGGAQSVGSIAASGRVLLADYSMGPIGGAPLGSYSIDALLNAVPVASAGAITVAGAITAGALTASSTRDIAMQGITTLAAGSALGLVDLRAGGALSSGAIVADGRLDARAGGTMDISSATAASSLFLNATGAITTGDLYGEFSVTVAGLGAVVTGALGSGAGSTISITSGGAMDLASVTSGGFAVLNAGGLLTSGDILAQGDVQVTGGDSVTLGAIRGPAGRAQIQAANALLTGAIDMTDGIALTSTTGSVTTGNLMTGTGPFAIGGIAITAGGAVSVGTMFARTGLVITAGTGMVLGAGSTDNGDIVLDAGGDITASDLVSGTGSLRVTAGGSAVLGNLAANGLSGGIGLGVSAGGTLELGNAAVNLGELRLTSSGAMTAGDLAAIGGALTVNAGGALGAGALVSGTRMDVTAAGAMDLVSANAGTFLTLTGGPVITTGALFGSSGLTVTGPGAITTGALGSGAGGAITISAGGTMDLASIASGDTALPGEVVTLSTGGAMTVGAITSFGNLVVTGGDRVTLGEVRLLAGGSANLSAVNSLAASLVEASRVAMTSTSGDIRADFLAGGTLDINAGGAVSVGTLNAFGGTSIAAGTNLTLGAVSSDLGDVVLTAGGDITSGNLSVIDGKLQVAAGGDAVVGSVFFSGLTSGVALDISSGGALQMGSASVTTGDVRLTSGGALTAAALTATNGAVSAVSATTMDLVSASAGGMLTLSSGGTVITGSLAGASGVTLTGLAGVSTGAVQSGAGGVSLRAADDLVSGPIVAAGAASLTSTAGIVQVGDLESTGSTVLLSAAGGAAAGVVRAANTITVGSGGNLQLTSATSAAGDILLDSGGGLSSGDLSAAGGLIRATSATAMNLGAANAGSRVVLSSGNNLTAGDLTGPLEVSATSLAGLSTGAVRASGGAVSLTAADQLETGLVSASGAVTLTSTNGAVAAGDLTSTGGAVSLTARGAGSAGQVTALNGIAMNAGSTLGVTSATSASGDVVLDAATDLTTGDLTAAGGRLLLSSGGATTAGNLSAAGLVGSVGLRVSTGTTLAVGNAVADVGELRLVSGGALIAGDLAANGGALDATSVGALLAGNIAATGAVSVQSTSGAVTAGSVSAGDSLALLALGDLAAGALTAGGRLTAGGVNVSLGNVLGASQLNVSAGGALVTGTVESTQGEVQMSSAGAMRTGAISAAAAIKIGGGQAAITTGSLTAGGAVLVRTDGDLTTGAARSQTSTVELRANGGSLTVGSVSAGTDLALAAANDLSVGNVSARDMLLLAGGNVRTGSLTSPDGRILVASNTLVDDGGAIGEYNFNAVFAGALRATGGTLAVTGPVTGGTFAAAVRGDANLLGVAASRSILVQSGGTVSLGGVLRSPQIELRSNDLVMPAGSGLNAGLAGTIRLVSGNNNGMRIGDGLDTSILPASSYTLDNAEWSRINSGSLSLFAIDGSGPVTMLIGKLDITGPDAGSTIDDPVGKVLFRTGESPTADPSGTIRVTGAIRGTGFRSGNALVFQAGQFQLASDTGSINLLGKGDTPLGSLQIAARDIHIAASSLLPRLAADPFFAGAEAALDQETAGGTGPVLNAGALDFAVGRTLYIQRTGPGTGTGTVPLGFEEPLDGFKISLAGADPITVIVNGTFRTAAGLVRGVDAWRLFKDSGVDLSGFTADSRLNGCLLNAATCGVVPPIDPRPDPDPGFRTLIDLLGDPPIGDPDEREPQSGNAIMPPENVLSAQPDGLPMQIDEPIAGSGNPALFGSSVGGGPSQ